MKRCARACRMQASLMLVPRAPRLSRKDRTCLLYHASRFSIGTAIISTKCFTPVAGVVERHAEGEAILRTPERRPIGHPARLGCHDFSQRRSVSGSRDRQRLRRKVMAFKYIVSRILDTYPGLQAEHVEGRLEYGSFASLKDRFLYIEVPKAASSSIKTLLRGLITPVRVGIRAIH